MDNTVAFRHKGDLLMIAGRPGMGKTSFALDIANQMAQNAKENILIISLDENKERIGERLQRKTNGHTEYHNISIYDNSKMSVKDIETLARKTENLGGIIIDYLQLLSNTDQWSGNGMTWELKYMAKCLNVPIICTSQVSAVCETRENKRPTLSDFRNEQIIELDFDQVLFLYRDHYYDSSTPVGDKAECIIVRNRHGACRTVNMLWNPQRLEFTVLDD